MRAFWLQQTKCKCLHELPFHGITSPTASSLPPSNDEQKRFNQPNSLNVNNKSNINIPNSPPTSIVGFNNIFDVFSYIHLQRMKANSLNDPAPISAPSLKLQFWDFMRGMNLCPSGQFIWSLVFLFYFLGLLFSLTLSFFLGAHCFSSWAHFGLIIFLSPP